MILEFAVLALIGAALLGREVRAQLFEPALAGSKPPAGQTMPAFAADGFSPPLARPDDQAWLLFATCAPCRSGDVVGGVLERFDTQDLPRDAAIHVIVWGPGADSWAASHRLPEGITVHLPTSKEAAATARERLGVGQSGVAFLYDRDGTWRSTFHLGQMREGDMLHDLHAVTR